MMASVAWLGMYDHPQQEEANDAFWQAIAERLVARGIRGVPTRLARSLDPGDAWSSSKLLFGQICTRPLAREHPRLRVLAHPVYRIAADPGFHHSLIVVKADDAVDDIANLRGATVAINDPGSNTGVALFRDLLAPLASAEPFFSCVTATGSHRSSALAVAEGVADVAAIDVVTWAALDRHEPHVTNHLRVIAKSPRASTPPFVTARETSIDTVAALRIVLDDVITDPAHAGICEALFLGGIVPPRADLFDRIAAQDARASSHRFPTLR